MSIPGTSLCEGDIGEEDTKQLTQFHYTTWPDKDVPRHCTPVLKFIKDVNQHHDRKTPLLLHCSAGAGRTGAIITIHGMMELAEEKGQVDIYNFVFSMRNSRPNIVQTASQYSFVHDAMLEYLFCKNTFTEAGIFAGRLKSLQEQNPETGNTYLEDEYEILNLVSPNLVPDKTRGSMKSDNMAKIRFMNSLPVDSSRPYLMTPRGDNDQSPYINASYMDGYKKKDLFISTQMPMANTVIDLWRMMYDYNCTSIVQLNALDSEDENCPQFWPNAGTNEYGPFTVSLMAKESTPDFEIRSLQLVYTKRDVKSPISVCHFQYTTWPKDDERPATSEGILQLISAVEKWQKTVESPGPIVVLCMNAAGRTGAFCTIQTCLDQIREEQGVDVLQNVKHLRIHRTNMVDTAAKYLFCYETILDYLKAFDDYASKKAYQNINVGKAKQIKDDDNNDVQYDNVMRSALVLDTVETKGSKERKQKEDEKNEGAANLSTGSEAKASSKSETDKNKIKEATKSEATGSEAKSPTESEAKSLPETKPKAAPPELKPKPTKKDKKGRERRVEVHQKEVSKGVRKQARKAVRSKNNSIRISCLIPSCSTL
ncbi:receptor-type tyrosine-protein phosphatase kappa-like [Amphiura filiformis]|uniref:receptor-type tyrosine-protein phosphatase kappa-like n=1 Tax=Amphiura filiformis TaxID=82378 RepID=UPI003B20C84B